MGGKKQPRDCAPGPAPPPRAGPPAGAQPAAPRGTGGQGRGAPLPLRRGERRSQLRPRCWAGAANSPAPMSLRIHCAGSAPPRCVRAEPPATANRSLPRRESA